jgi:hypothetical protein
MKETTDQPRTNHRAQHPPARSKPEPAEKGQRCALLERAIVRSQARSSFQQAIAQRLRRAQDACAGAPPLDPAAGGGPEVTLSEYRLIRDDLRLISKDRLHLMGRAIMDSASLITEIERLEKRKRELNGKSDPLRGSDRMENWLVDPQAQTIDVLDVKSDRHLLVVRQTDAMGASNISAGFARATNHPSPTAITLYFLSRTSGTVGD